VANEYQKVWHVARFVIPVFVAHNVHKEPEHTRHIFSRFMDAVKSPLVDSTLPTSFPRSVFCEAAGVVSAACIDSHPTKQGRQELSTAAVERGPS